MKNNRIFEYLFAGIIILLVGSMIISVLNLSDSDYAAGVGHLEQDLHRFSDIIDSSGISYPASSILIILLTIPFILLTIYSLLCSFHAVGYFCILSLILIVILYKRVARV